MDDADVQLARALPNWKPPVGYHSYLGDHMDCHIGAADWLSNYG